MLSLVCPVYNEAGNIGRLLDSVAAQVRVPFELTIVYDFDEDDTLPIVRERMQASPFPIRLLRNNYGSGALSAVKTGLEAGAGRPPSPSLWRTCPTISTTSTRCTS